MYVYLLRSVHVWYAGESTLDYNRRLADFCLADHCARGDGLLPNAMLRAGPPGQVSAASGVVTRLALVLAVVPLCSCFRVDRLQGVASASSLPSTEGTCCFDTARATVGLRRPAVLLPCWALGAKPGDLLATFQPYFVREVSLRCIAFVIPLC